LPQPAVFEWVETAAAAVPAAMAGQLLAGLDKLLDSDLLNLVSALGAEAERRGLTPVRTADEPALKSGARLKPSASAGKTEASSIPTSKANAIRAALKAGVKPGAAARQFGVSIAQIRKLFDEG